MAPKLTPISGVSATPPTTRPPELVTPATLARPVLTPPALEGLKPRTPSALERMPPELIHHIAAHLPEDHDTLTMARLSTQLAEELKPERLSVNLTHAAELAGRQGIAATEHILQQLATLPASLTAAPLNMLVMHLEEQPQPLQQRILSTARKLLPRIKGAQKAELVASMADAHELLTPQQHLEMFNLLLDHTGSIAQKIRNLPLFSLIDQIAALPAGRTHAFHACLAQIESHPQHGTSYGRTLLTARIPALDHADQLPALRTVLALHPESAEAAYDEMKTCMHQLDRLPAEHRYEACTAMLGSINGHPTIYSDQLRLRMNRYLHVLTPDEAVQIKTLLRPHMYPGY